ncbi:zinc finger protein hangover isoform X1 [Drosophila gunungcola]|uniref:zinc finger protein hangover isoform X1 n=1 Tax=Drosophila gunungcola TaxID=103775 RepID=UPI0022DEDA1E|nr:zinc finger protein hangover isoform X1 [Drosophila gunungcola]
MCDAAAATTATTSVEATATPGTGMVTGTPAGMGSTTGTGMGTNSPEATAATPTPKGERSARQNCCRLCVAPQTECISIINSYAADKEPLSTKIHNCVSIKITPQDRLSLQICHACISYLNSWQSFKNRCYSSQTKQRQWLEANKSKLFNYLDLNSAENGGGSFDHQQQQHQQQQQQQSESELEAEKATPTAAATAANILDGIHSLKKRKSLTVYPLPAIPIKDEPIDTDDDYQMKSIDESDDMVDPTMFLERSEHEGDVPLTASDYDYTAQHGVNASSVAASLPPNAVANVAAAGDSKVASCRACSLQFSTRANARRHERNLHPNLFQLSTDSPHNTPITKPTPALAAALEIQRAAAAAATAEANRAAGAAGGNISTQKYRQVVMNAFIKCEGGGYDYDNPEQYRPLLTRDKVEFIEQNDEFLEQYQTMTCRCCSKYFSTYKNFMAHVRKKYPMLPRNLCFNCLKMNDSKALFISHLKKRNCINLFRVLNALRGKTTTTTTTAMITAGLLDVPASDDAEGGGGGGGGVIADVDADADARAEVVTMSSPTVTTAGAAEAGGTPGGSSERPEKLRAKELLVNKLYECKLCPKGFRTKHEFRTHVYDKHADVQRKDNNSIQCSFCGLDFADPVDRRRHYNNMDCIVRLRCMTCDAKLETHQRFLDHVYQDHLGGVGGGGGASSDNASTTGSGMARSNSMEHSPGKRSLLGALGIGVGSSADESRSSSAAPPLTSTPKLAAQVGASATASGSASAQSSANRDASAPKSQYFSRMPQVCPICGQQYNNYNNVLRHMESKHPNKLPETYKCVRCGLGYPRISYLREHMINVHGVDKNRHSGGFEYIVNADAVKLADGSTPNVYTGRYDYVMKDLMSITNGGTLDDEEEEPGSVAKKMRLDDSSNNSSLVGVASQQKECPICNAVFSNNIGLSNHMRSHYTASNAVNAALAAANRMTPKSLTITATPAADSEMELLATAAAASSVSMAPATPANVPPAMANQTPQEQAVFRRSLDQAADRRFRRMRCRICQRRFSSKKSYRYHMLTDHQVQNVQFIKCKLCNAEFAYEKGLKVHLFKVHGRAIKDEMIIKQFECEVCSIVYSSELELQQHKRSVHKLTSVSASASTSVSASSKIDDDSLMEEAKPTAAELANLSALAAGASANASASGQGLQGTPLYWYQCKYCPSNFNTNKKLAIHINSHDEFDSNDYSCKDCGNVYSGRKSLWVHRYKKHPQVPDPAECSLCRKVFFDRQMHDNHTPTCNRKPITSTGAHQQQEPQLQQQQQQASLQPGRRTIFRHKTGDDEDEEEEEQDEQQLEDRANSDGNGTTVASGSATTVAAVVATSLKIRIPEVACTICGARFTDQEHFSKHIQKHEQELYVDNPLAAMFDDGPADVGQFQVERQNENGEYACDLCAKTFPQVIALKVHRKWHFRGDSKQNPIDGEATQLTNNNHTTNNNNNSMLHLRELHAVGLMPNQQQQQQQQSLNNSCNSSSMNNHNNNNNSSSSSNNRSKSMKRKRELKCEYCASTFISNNNLRRHMYELHKHEVSNLPEPPVIVVDEYLTCRRCQLKFETKELWIEHKLADAKVVRPFCPFQWGCDLCGEYLSRKEKLMNHINNHLKEEVIVPVATKAAIERTAAQEAAAATADAKAAAATTPLTSAGEAMNTEKQSLDNGQVAAATAAAAVAAATTSSVKLEEGREEEDSDDLDEEDSSGEEEESSGTGDDEDDDTDDEDGEGEDEDEEGDGGEGEDEEGVQPPGQLLPQKQHKAANHNQDDDDLVEEVISSDDDEGEDDGEVESDDDEDGDDDGEDDDDEEEEDDDVEEPEPVALPVRPLMNGKSKMPPLIVASSDDEDDDGVLPIEDIIEEEFDEDADPDPDPEEDAIEEVDDDDLDEGDVEDEPNVVSTASSSESESTTTTTSNSHSHSTGERRKKADDQLNDPGFTCDLCQLCFDSQELLQSHIKSHFLNGPKLSTAAAAVATKPTAAAATASGAAATSVATATATLATAAKTKPDSKSAVLAINNNNKSKTVAATAAKSATTVKTATAATN